MTKKVLALLLAVLLVFGLAACGGESTGGNNGDNNYDGGNNGGNNAASSDDDNGGNDSAAAADDIAGKWKVTKIGYKEGGEEVYAAVELYTLVYEFAADGSYYEHFTQDGVEVERISAENMKATYTYDDGKLTVTQVWNDTLLDTMRDSFSGMTDEEILAKNAVKTEYTISKNGKNLKMTHSADGVDTYWILESAK